MISIKRIKRTINLRAHRMFLDAPDDVIESLGHWLAGKKTSRDLVREYIDANDHLIAARAQYSRKQTLTTEGKRFDLHTLRDYINDAFLQNRSTALFTWGRRVTRRKTKSIRLGSYSPVKNLITISRRLDRSDIPRYMIEYVVFHEMLHEVLGIGERPDGRRDIHGDLFRLMEETYPHYEKARAFEKKKWG